MRTTGLVRRGAAAVLLALNIVFFFRVAQAVSPRVRGLLDVSHVENGEGLRLAQHARGGDPSARMPIGTLTEAAAFDRLSPRALSAWALTLYAVAALLAFSLARELGGDWAGLSAAAAWQAIFLGLPKSSGFLKQFWLTGLGLLAAVAIVRHTRRPRPASAAAAGAAFGLTALTRSVYFVFVPALAAIEAARDGAPRTRLLRALLILAAFAAVLLPWTAMNARVTGRLQAVERGAGDLNIVLGALGAVHGGEGDHVAFMGAPESERGRSPIGWAIRTVVSHPARYARAVAKRAAYALGLRPWLFALAFLGLLAARRDPGARVLALQCAYFVAIVCAMPVEASYFEPLWPLLLALAAAPLGLLAPPRPARAGALIAAGGVVAAAALGGLIAVRSSFAALSYAARRERRPPWSDAALDEALSRGPGEAWSSLEDARRRLRRHDAAGAARVLEASAPAIGDLPRHRLLLAWARAKAGAPESLLALAAPAPPEAPPFNDDLREILPVYQALALDAAGRRPEALERMGAAADAHRGGLRFLHPEEEGALADLDPRLVARIDESFAGFLQTVLEEDEPADLDRALGLAAEARPTFAGWVELGRALAARGRRKDAVRALERAGALAREPEQLHRLQFAWAEIGEGERARLLLETLTRRFPERAVYWSDLGVALYGRGDVVAAETAFGRALRVEPGMAAATLSLAAILNGRGRGSEARRLCARALDLWPGDAGSEEMRAPLAACRDGRPE